MQQDEPRVAAKKKALVVVAPEAHEKIENYVDLCHGECSWVGEVELTEEKGLLVAYVKEIDFLKQWCTGGETYMDPVWLQEWMEKHGYVDGEQTPEMYLYWGHSHVNMGVFWSGTDEACVKSFLEFTGQGAVASVVYNKRGEWKARLDYNVKTRMLGKDRAVQGTLEADMEVDKEDFGTREGCELEVKTLVTVGRAPQRDLSDDRLAALEAEDRAKGKGGPTHWGPGWHPNPGGHGMVYRPYEVDEERRNAGAMVVYGEDTEYSETDLIGVSAGPRGETQVGWVYCRECKVRDYCATQVIKPAEMGCRDREKLVVVTQLEKRHWKEAKRGGTSKGLQAWRDKRHAEIGAAGKVRVEKVEAEWKFCKDPKCVEKVTKESGVGWLFTMCSKHLKEAGLEGVVVREHAQADGEMS